MGGQEPISKEEADLKPSDVDEPVETPCLPKLKEPIIRLTRCKVEKSALEKAALQAID